MRFFTSVHLLLLVYTIAAIVYWGIKLQKQSVSVYSQEVITLRSQVDSAANPTLYNQRLTALKKTLSMRTIQFAGEGGTFLVVILIGAFVVYTSFRRRIMLSRQQNNFMLAVTHELKSPIAAMKLNLQTLEKHTQLEESKRQELLVRCIKESNRLNDLCNNMLFASQLEGRQYRPAREPFDFSELLRTVVMDYAHRYPRVFDTNIQPGITMVGDRVMLQMAINNLLENAMKYTPDDSPVSITLLAHGNDNIVQIADRGLGIPDAEKKKVFNKFYRVGSEESRRSKGTGLGLYLSNKIVLQHKGRIIVKDNTPNGAIFEMCLPA